MTTYGKKTIWFTVAVAILILLIVLGGWRERGYLAFDSGFLLLLLSPLIISTWYKAERNEYYYRKSMEDKDA